MKSSSILIVTSDSQIAQDLRKHLDQLGYGVSGISAGGEAISAKIEELKPDLIMTDIRLPSDRGRIQTGELIHSIYDIPIIYITNGDDRDALQRAKLSTPWGIIFVPYDSWQLLGAIETALHGHQLESELRKSRKWLNTTLISIGEGVIATDADGRVQFINPTAQKLVGWTQVDAHGMPFQKIFTLVEEGMPEDLDPISIQNTTDLKIGKDIEGILVSKTGRRIPVGINATLINDDRGHSLGTVLVFRDLTKQKVALSEIRREANRAEALVEAASQLNKQLELETVLNKICVITNEALKAIATAVFLREPKKQFHRSMATYSKIPSLQQYAGDDYKIPSEILENILSLEHPVSVIPDMQAYPHWPHLDLAQTEDIHTLVLTALIRQDQIIGTLISVVPSGQYALNTGDSALLRGLAAQASSAIENAELFEQVRMGRERQRKLAKNLLNRPEARFKGETSDLTRKAGLLHDIGKLGISMDILMKPGKLTPDEYEIVKAHSAIGSDLVKSSPSLRPLVSIIRHHYEHFDGKGYPDRLAGNRISIEARIISVADALDVMISDRPYRRAIPVGQIMEELKRCAGTQFDPLVVDAALQILAQQTETEGLPKVTSIQTARIPELAQSVQLP